MQAEHVEKVLLLKVQKITALVDTKHKKQKTYKRNLQFSQLIAVFLYYTKQLQRQLKSIAIFLRVLYICMFRITSCCLQF